MSFFVTEPQATILTAIDPSTKPKKQQVAQIAQLTRYGTVVLEEVQRTLFERLVQPEFYHWREIENTLIVVHQCLFIGSLGFVKFFKERIYAVAALTNYQGNPDSVVRVQRVAKVLLGLLQDDERLQLERGNSMVPSIYETLDPTPFRPSGPQAPTRGRTMATWRDWRITPNVTPFSTPTHLPTPKPSPVRRTSSIEKEDSDNHDSNKLDIANSSFSEGETVGVMRGATENTPSTVTHKQLEKMARMTFESGDLDVLVGVLVERLLASGHQQNYHHLVKTLTIINHCLFHGSETFAAWFREIRGMVTPLCTFPVEEVRELATRLLQHLDDDAFLEASRDGPQRRHSFPSPLGSASLSSSPNSEPISLSEPVKDLTAFVTTMGLYPIATGGYSYVYRAMLRVGSSNELVAKKVLTTFKISRGRLEKRWNREIRTWTVLSHPNIAEFYGITRETNGSVGLVSPYFSHGNIMEYIESLQKSHVDILQFMRELVAGVEYLHKNSIVHGDIKGSNVMIDDTGRVKLIDFGLSRAIGESGYTTSGPGISWAWAAPELLLVPDTEPVAKTKSSDVYAIAITFVEIMSGRPPYSGMSGYAIMDHVKHGCVPERPSPEWECYFVPGDTLWALMLCCWARIPQDRPTIETVRDAL